MPYKLGIVQVYRIVYSYKYYEYYYELKRFGVQEIYRFGHYFYWRIFYFVWLLF